jgi:uncharacterized protein YggE
MIKTLVALVILMGMLVCLVGCDSKADELEKQHHLYNISVCTVETNEADDALKSMGVWDKTTTAESKQRQHDYRAVECMANLEHTTIKFQQDKHDSYGEVEK